MAKTINGPTGELKKLQEALDGIAKLIPTGSTETVGGLVYSQPQLLAKVEGFIKSFTDLLDLRAQYATQFHKALAVRVQAAADGREFLKDLRAALIARLGRGAPELAQFGFAPEKPRTPLTSAQKVQKLAKAKATRDRLGTKGKRQRAEALKALNEPRLSVGSDGTISIVPELPPSK